MIEARNSFGYSYASEFLSIPFAFKPDTPSAPKTLLNSEKITISWSEPNNQASAITSYTI
jgi:hypothetical protein